MALVTLEDNDIRPYHVGDSEVILVGQRGKLKLRTVSHSPTSYALHAGLISADEAMFHSQRHLIFNAIGFDDMRIEIGDSIPMALKDTLLLATDGLLDNMHIEEICETVASESLLDVAQTLVQQCHQTMHSTDTKQPSKPDDLTFILFRRA